MRNSILFIFLFIPSVVWAEHNLPTVNEMKSWWSKNENVEISFYDPDRIKEVYLTNKERAYLTSVSVANRGRNNMFQTALVRPELEKVQLLEGTIIKSVIKVVDLDSDNTSEILVERSGSGQGYESGVKAIVQINEIGQPILLRKMKFKNNEGACGKRSHRYFMKDIQWEFVDIDGDGIKDLNETRIVHEGRNNRPPIETVGLYRYVFKNGKFIRYIKYKQMLNE